MTNACRATAAPSRTPLLHAERKGKELVGSRFLSCPTSCWNLRHIHPAQLANREKNESTKQHNRNYDDSGEAEVVTECEATLIESMHQRDCVMSNAQQPHAGNKA